jgi:hypothetical protein
LNKAHRQKKQKKYEEQLQIQGAKYALNVYRKAVSYVLGLGEKRLDRIDQKFIQLLEYDDVMQARKKAVDDENSNA